MKNFFKNYILPNLYWILIIVSLIIYVVSQQNYFSEFINKSLDKFSVLTFSSGIFAATLKSITFSGLFKQIIEDAMTSTDFIENRSEENQHKLWKATSKAIYKKKFPEISNFLESRILETYLPTTHDFYYRDYRTTIDIKEITDDFQITYEQTVKFSVVLDPKLNEAELVSSIQISEESGDENYINNCLKYEINGYNVIGKTLKSIQKDDNEIDFYDSTIDHETKTETTTIKLKSSVENKLKEFNIVRKYNRSYSLVNENYKLVRMRTFTKGLEVFVKYPDNVGVSFFNIGNVEFFEKQNEDIDNIISRSHNTDVMLPYQGFGLSFQLKNRKTTKI